MTGIPSGWRLCPDCNGEGVIWRMSTGPDLDEYQYDCTRCAATNGLVPVDD